MTPPEKYSLVDIATLSEAGRLTAAHLVMEALPPYYEVDGIEEAEMANAVAAILGDPGSEIGKGFAALCGDQVAGILNFIKAESLPGARLVGAQKLLKQLSGESVKVFREHLRNYNADFGDVPGGSLYLSRIAIGKGYRGTGLAGQMMERYLTLNNDSEEKQTCFSLHVDRNNERAIAFYRKFGFTSEDSETRYLTMTRN